jgi:hypothetical protein
MIIITDPSRVTVGNPDVRIIIFHSNIKIVILK